MPHRKIVISSLFFIFSFFFCKAQENNKYVYQDSASLSADSIAVKTESTTVSDSSSDALTNNAVQPDNILRLNNLTLSRDSVEALKNAKAFAYAKNLDSLLIDLKKKNKEQTQDTINKADWLEKLLASSFTKVLLWTLAVAFIVFILYKLFFVSGFFQRSITKNNVHVLDENKSGTHLQEYDKQIAAAILAKDYRLAVRYLYLQSLQKLSENNLVQLEAKKTNYQYINELSNTSYKDGFLWLTLNYEYVWYGEFAVSEDLFQQLKERFEKFNSQLQKR